ncbi:MAG: VOC family protein [Anaerolineae bacterium]|nr:VOC family protein [Anaerolineae bacterium]
MIEKVGTVSVFVKDQERAKQFYTKILGLELRSDQPLFPGSPNRWISVAPSGADTEIILYLPDENWEHYQQVVGKSQAVTLTVKDMQSYYKELLDKNVNFIQKPEKQPWGTYALIADSEDNHLILVEH